MRKVLFAALVVVTGCGGGGGSGGGGPVKGTIAGQAFTPAEISAVTAGPASCTVDTNPGTVTINAKALAIRLSSATGLCTDLTNDPLCKLDADAQTVTVAFADIEATNPPALGKGTFHVNPDPTIAVPANSGGPLAGTLVVAFGAYVSLATGATCPAQAEAAVAEGTLRIDSVSGSAITGNLDLKFGSFDGTTFTPNGDSLKGDFTATVCPGSIDSDTLCSLASTGGHCSSPHC